MYSTESHFYVKFKPFVCWTYQNERKVISLDVPYDDPDNHPNRVEWITTRERAEHLASKGLVEIRETIKEKEIDSAETKKVPTTKVETKKVNKKSK